MVVAFCGTDKNSFWGVNPQRPITRAWPVRRNHASSRGSQVKERGIAIAPISKDDLCSPEEAKKKSVSVKIE